MKKIYKLDLNDERDAHIDKAMAQAEGMFSVLEELCDHLRSRTKHEELSDEQYTALYSVRDKIGRLLEDHNVSLWE